MRLLYIDIDTLRADHLGCYGYHRATSPNIDWIARSGTRFDQVYVSDSPCLPSRTALWSGRFGLTTGVVNHGGRRADPFPSGPERGRRSRFALTSWPALLRDAGMTTATVSTFAERHSAFHWYAGFNEVFNLGTDGKETADAVFAAAEGWLTRRGREDDWFLHVHFWDTHTPYRTPRSFGDPFGSELIPQWLDEGVLEEHRTLTGPHSAREITGWTARPSEGGRQPAEASSMADVRAMFDGYDTALAYVDGYVGRLVDLLSQIGVEEDTAILISSDHGENLGELGIYCDHQTADMSTHRVPAILRWPGIEPSMDRRLLYQFDLAAMVAELAGASIPDEWDARADGHRSDLVLSCGAWTVQRAVRFDRWLCISTYHDGYHGFPETMLFDVETDPHEQVDLAESRPDLVGEAAARLAGWWAAAMARAGRGEDPLWTVVAEGGGLYVRGPIEEYLERLVGTGRAEQAKRLAGRRRPVGRVDTGRNSTESHRIVNAPSNPD